MRKLSHIILFSVLSTLLILQPAGLQSARSDVVLVADLSITDSGFDPAVITVAAGQGIHWTNISAVAHSVTADSGLFDSGLLSPDAGFSLTIPLPGIYTYQSTENPLFVGEIRVVQTELEGPTDALANSHIPEITIPVQTAEDLGEYPVYGFLASRTRILLGFTDVATVAQANAAIQSAGVVIIGGIPDVQTLLVEAADTQDFSALDAALEILLADSAVEFAATSAMLEANALPQPAESGRANGGPITWEWDVVYGPNDEPIGAGGNWGLEDARFPQAWNLLEEVHRRNNVEAVLTGVVDLGFVDHEDLEELTFEVICKPLSDGGEKCSSTTLHDHGVAVSGVIGATYNNDSAEVGRSLGVSGGNPVARMIGVNSRAAIDQVPGADAIEFMTELIKQFPDVRVINFSMGFDVPGMRRDPVTLEPDASEWWADFGAPRTCGPGPDDDETAAATQLCTPNNEDGWLERVANWGKLARNLAELASTNEVIIVQSAGNDGDYLCLGVVQDAPGCVIERMKAENGSSLSWASHNWTSSDPNPIVIVEATNLDHELAFFSDDGGDVSAPGQRVLTTGVDKTAGVFDPTKSIYIAPTGTSFSAPYVTALIGYMLAYEPLLTIDEVVTRLIIWGRSDVSDGGQPRIDAFNAMMSIPGAVMDLVDVNDDSMDGNRRVVLGEGEVQEGVDLFSSIEIDQFTGENYRTSPDGVVNMRDFRRFRDAWLQKCLDTPLGEPDCAAIQSFSDIVLDGDFFDPNVPLHPKKDLNFDGCVRVLNDLDCLTKETAFPRFDFNGDGQVSRFDQVLVPLAADGTLAETQADASAKTDLEVLMSVWATDPAATEGWTSTDLDGLMVSGDIQVNGDAFFAAGADEITISTRRLDTDEFLPARTLNQGDPGGMIILTVPALVDVEIGVTAAVNGGPLTAAPRIFNVKAGQDRRLDACADMLFLFPNHSVLSADGSSEIELTARLERCDDGEVEGLLVEFSQSPSGSDDGALTFSDVSTDAAGEATNTYTAGTDVENYDIDVRIEFPDGSEVTASAKIRTEAPVKIAYRWKQTVLEFNEEGSSRWGPTGDPLGDCDDTVIQSHFIPDEWSSVGFILDTVVKQDPMVTLFVVFEDGVEVARFGVDVLPGETLPQGFFTVPAEVAGWAECVDAFSFESTPLSTSYQAFPPLNQTLEREGTISQTGDSLLLDEFITESIISGHFAWNASSSLLPGTTLPPPPTLHRGAGYMDIRIPADEMERYQDYVLPPTVSIQATADGVSVSGLSEIAELEYPYDSLWTYTNVNLYGDLLQVPFSGFLVGDVRFALEVIPTGFHQSELMLVPRGDGSALQHTSDPSQPITFTRDEFGDYQKYEYCQVVESEYTTPREYVSSADGFAGDLWKRNNTYDGISASDTFGSWMNEYPMPVGPGTSRFEYSFVAIPYTTDSELEDLILGGQFDPPNCEGVDPLTAQFDAVPNPSDEGGLVGFTDQSVSPGNSIVSWEWDFGDGDSSDEQSPTHFYDDDGEYEVQLTVTDATGATDTETLTLTVENVAPSVHVSDVIIVEGQSASLNVLLADVSVPDQQALDLLVSISGSGLNPIDVTVPAGIQTFGISGLASGIYPVTATVTDKDGGIGIDNAVITVLGINEPPPPPPPPVPPLSSCDPAISIDGEALLFLDLINAYRDQAGVQPLQLSPALTRAARRHTFDMATNQFIDHIGSDNSTPVTRALESGYPSDNISENLASGLDLAIEALFGWQSSPEHNMNMLDPAWEAIGIARSTGSVAYWATSFGSLLDCVIVGVVPPGPDTDTMLASNRIPSKSAISEHPLVLSSSGGDWQSRLPWTVASQGTNLSVPFAALPTIHAQVILSGDTPPFTAFVISDTSPEERTAVTFINRSRSALGQPIGAILDPGDGTGPFALLPGASRQHTYLQDGTVTVGLTATDSAGISSTVQREIVIADVPLGPADFNLTLAPSSHVFAPDTTVNFLVSLTSINGFDSPVDLSVGTLPSGVTAQFTPPTVTPSGTAVLKLIAASDAETGQFDLNVTGISGGISHTTDSSVTLNFGLIPLCHGAIDVEVTDADTGLPIAGALFGGFRLPTGLISDADGRIVSSEINLGNNNSDQIYLYTVGAPGYWQISPFRQFIAQCGIVTPISVQLIRVQHASIGGQVVVGEPDPNDTSRTRQVFPTDVPIEGVSIFGSIHSDVTDSNGFYLFQDVALSQDNTPRSVTVQVPNPDGYWFASTPVTVEANQHSEVNIALVPVCWTSVSGTLVFDDTGLPATGIPMRLFGQDLVQSTTTATTNELGEFNFPVVSLGWKNSVASRIISVSATPEYFNLSSSFELTGCDETVEVALELDVIQRNFSTLQGEVFDNDTGEPIPDAQLVIFLGGTLIERTDSDGLYNFDQILVGTEDQTSTMTNVSVTASVEGFPDQFYWSKNVNVTLNADEIHTLDIGLTKQQFGLIAGTVRDAATKLPIAGVTFGVGVRALPGAGPTGPDGSYESSPLALNAENQPREWFFGAFATDYWPISTSAVVEAGKTTIADIELIRVCTDATISGTVVNAVTGLPIQQAAIDVSSKPRVFTDSDGNFVVSSITVGTNNTPIQVQVNASAAGFVTQSKVVTIFCGASIVVEFGQSNTATGTIQGTVTDGNTDLPIPGAFIGSEFGSSTTTNASGSYTLSNVPLGFENSDRDWEITAAPTDFTPQAKIITAVADQVSILDFEFTSTPNVAPAVTATGDTIDEGGTATVDVSFTDPGVDDTHTAVIDWGDGSAPEDLGAVTSPFSPTHDYADDGVFDVTVTVTDDDTGEGQAETTVTVNNVAPVATLGDDGPVDEGSQASVSFSAQSDPSSDDTTAGFLYSFDFGNDGSFEVVGSAVPTELVPLSLTSDGPVTVTVAGRITDKDGGFTDYTSDVQVNNVAPSVTSSGDSVTLGDEATVGVSFTDPGTPDMHTAVIDWGDGSAVEDLGAVTSPFDATHTYATADTFTVTVTVTDDDGGVGETTANAVVIEPEAPEADLSVTKTDSVDPVITGDNIVYTITVTNNGPDTAENAAIADELPDGFSVVSLTPSAGTCADLTVGFTCALGDIPSGGQVTVTATVSTGSAGTHTNTVAVVSDTQDSDTANNTASEETTVLAPPVADAAGPYVVDEGSTVPLDGSGSSDSDGTIVLFEWDLDEDGVFGETGVDAANGDETGVSPAFSAALLDGPDTVTVSLRVTDNDGLSDTATTEITVNNVAPAVTATGDTIDEGDTATVDVSFTDPGVDDTHTAVIDWGDGSAVEDLGAVTSPFSPTHIYTDNGVFDVTVTVTDDDTGVGEATTTVTVNNVVPVVSATGDTIDEGGTATVDVSFTDPGVDDAHTAVIDWGDGSAVEDLGAVTSPFSPTHIYTDDGVFDVTVTVTDDDTGEGQAATTVTVNNVAPVATLGDDGPVDEGSQASVSFSAQSDPSSDDTTAGFLYSFDFGNDGSFEVVDSAVPTELVPLSLTSDGPVTVTVAGRITDKDGGFTDYTSDVQVDNVAPSVTSSGDSVTLLSEGSIIGVSFTDPGTPDTHTAVIDWGDGTADTNVDPATSPFDVTHTYATADTFTVTVTITDDDGGEGETTTTVVVVPPDLDPPVADAGGPYVVDEGSSVVLDGSGSTDSDGTIVLYEWDLDEDGVFGETGVDAANGDETGVSPTFSAGLLDGPDTVTVSLRVTDDDGLSDTATADVTVTNVAPAVVAAGNSVALGEETTVGVVFTDPGVADTHSAVIDWGDGSAVEDLGAVTSPFDATHTYATASTFTVTVTVTDDDGGEGVATPTVIVTPLAPPVADAGGPYVVDEGSSVVLDGTGSTDSDGTIVLYEWDLDGDGVFGETGVDAGNGDETGVSPTFSAGLLDGPDTVTVSLRVTDDDGLSDTATADVTVTNVAPAVVAAGNSVALGEETTVGVVFTDPGVADTHSAVIDWGDGSAVEDLGAVTSPFDVSHTYATADTFAVTMTVTDDDGGVGETTANAVVIEPEAPEADLSVTKTDSVDPVISGDNIVYTITVTNNGPDTAEDVTLTDTLPAEIELVSIAGSAESSCQVLPGTISCDLGDIPSGGEIVLTVTVATTEPGTLTNTAEVASDTQDPNSENNSASETTAVLEPPEPEADLSVTKTDSVDPVVEGDEVTYTITVVNSGPDTAENVTLTDTLPAGVEVVSISSAACEEFEGVITCSLGDIPSSGMVTVTVTVATDETGTLTNSVSVSSTTADPDTANNGASESTSVIEEPVGEIQTIWDQVDSSPDDAFETLLGWPGYRDEDERVYSGAPGIGGPTYGGFRWDDLFIPEGAIILEAYVELQQKNWGNTVETMLAFESIGSPGSFSADNSPADRWEHRTQFSIPWTPDLQAPESFHVSPDLAAGIQELVNSHGGLNSIVLLESGEGVEQALYRQWSSFDLNAETAAMLHITFLAPNVAPEVEAGPGAEITEGGTVSLAPAEFTDSSQGDFTATIDWGDGTVEPGFVVQGVKTVHGSHVYADNGIYAVTVSVTDAGGLTGSDSFTVTVLNAAPMVNAGGDQAANTGDTVQVNASFTDEGVLDTHLSSINWGDGTVEPGTLTQGAGSGSVSGPHVYATAGEYTVSVCVTDNAGDAGCDELIVTVSAPVGPGEVWAHIDSSEDDAYDDPTGWPDFSATDVRILVGAPGSTGPTYGGWRWDDLGIPDNAVITSAYVEFTQAGWGNEFATTLALEDNGAPASFTEGSTPANRWQDHTDFEAAWSWTRSLPNDVHISPDLTPGIQELVDRYGSLDAVVLIESGEGVDQTLSHEWRSFDEDPTKAARLHVTWTVVPVEPESGTIAAQVAAGEDDAHHDPTGWPNYSSSDIRVLAGAPGSIGPTYGGWRWADLDIPANAIITSAYVELAQAGYGNEFATTLSLQDDAAPASFTEGSTPANRWQEHTDFETAWSWTRGEPEDIATTPDLTAGVQELVNRHGGLTSLVLLESGEGVTQAISHEWHSFEGNPTLAATLHIQWTAGS